MSVALQVLGLLLALSPIIFFMWLFWWLRRSANRGEPKQDGSVLVFQVSPRMRFLVRLVVLLLVSFLFLY
jgi:hypothetical protein